MIGLASVSFRENEPLEIIKEASKCGLNCIEWGSDVHAPVYNEENLKNIKSECDKYGIVCSSYGTYFRIGEYSTDKLYDYIKSAKTLGTDILRVWCGNKDAHEYSEEEKEVFFEECKKIAKIAEKENVKICMECHRNSFVSKIEPALLLMKTVSSPNFRMYWQPDPFVSVTENLEYAEKISDYTEIIHVFNWIKGKQYPLKKAVDIWKMYLSKFHNNIPALLEFMPDGKIESLKEETNALKEITKEKNYR